MTTITDLADDLSVDAVEQQLFCKIAQDLVNTGVSVNTAALPLMLTATLVHQLSLFSPAYFIQAGVGRANKKVIEDSIRANHICWIDNQTQACTDWNTWIKKLQSHLNRKLFLGLNDFESHFSHYQPGGFYKRHYDAFQGNNARIVSIVVYFNSWWLESDGGALVLYQNDQDILGLKIMPAMSNVVLFMSQDFPHEVLPSSRDRYAIAGWFKRMP